MARIDDSRSRGRVEIAILSIALSAGCERASPRVDVGADAGARPEVRVRRPAQAPDPVALARNRANPCLPPALRECAQAVYFCGGEGLTCGMPDPPCAGAFGPPEPRPCGDGGFTCEGAGAAPGLCNEAPR